MTSIPLVTREMWILLPKPWCLSFISLLPASSVTVPWLSNNMSADHEDVHVPVKKAKPKQNKVVVFWCTEITLIVLILTISRLHSSRSSFALWNLIPGIINLSHAVITLTGSLWLIIVAFLCLQCEFLCRNRAFHLSDFFKTEGFISLQNLVNPYILPQVVS